jgi:galactose-1-phosphate uridylyltransferase
MVVRSFFLTIMLAIADSEARSRQIVVLPNQFEALRRDSWEVQHRHRFGDIVAYPVLGGLHHRYARI